MMKHDSRTPEDGTHVGSPSQTDLPLDQIKKLARELYIPFPFDVDDMEHWKELVRGQGLLLRTGGQCRC
jgi:hypothetical protein